MVFEECIACHSALPDDGRFMSCAECKHGYHLGQPCSGIAPNTFANKSQAKRETWVCKTCRAGRQRDASASQMESSQTGNGSSVGPSLVSELREIKDSIASLLTLHAKVDSLLLLKTEFTKLSMSVGELEESVSFVSKQYDSVLEEMKANKEREKAQEEEIVRLNEVVKAQATQLELLQEVQNETEQYNRKNNLEIEGLPLEQNENLKQVLSEVAIKLELTSFSSTDVEAVHRMPSKRKPIPTVLIRFTSVAAREAWFDSRGKLRQLHQNGSLPKLFFNDNLTKANRSLFWRARTVSKENGYKFAWVKGGKIFVKKDEGAPLIRVIRPADIARIV